MKHSQRGFSLAVVVILLVVVMVAMVATYTLSRFTGSRDERETTRARLEAAMGAIDAFAARSQRLPCPASVNATAAGVEGLEVRNGTGCSHADGVLPWATLGLPKDAGYDGWGRRLSYRVHVASQSGFTTTSLTQDGGTGAVLCDTWPVTGSELTGNGLCNADRDTDPAKYLALNRLRLTEKADAVTVSTVRNDVAYLVMSHGATGFGGYTVSGARLEMPRRDELDNTRNEATGFFTRPFSDVETKANANEHFDDVVVFRTIADLVKRANLSARDWPETAAPPDAARFDLAAVTAAAGGAPSGTDTGQSALEFAMSGGGRVTAVGVQGSNVRNISFDTVAGTGGIGVTGSGNPRMTYAEGEFMVLLFDFSASRFAMTLNDFGTFTQAGTTMTENVLIIFYQGSNVVRSVVKGACRADGGLASFEIDVGASFDAVVLAPAASTGTTSGGTSTTGDTGFLLSEVRSCASSTQEFCRTSLSSAQNTCSPDLRVEKSSSATFREGGQGTYTINVRNVGMGATSAPVTVTDNLPNRLSYVSAAGSSWSCSASGRVVTCSTAAVIAAGASAPPITLTVSVANNAAPSVTNEVTVSGGDEISSFRADNNATVSTPVSP